MSYTVVYIRHPVEVEPEISFSGYSHFRDLLGSDIPYNSTTSYALPLAYKELQEADPGDVIFVQPREAEESGEKRIIYDTFPEYYFVKALEKLGKRYYRLNLLVESCECLKPLVEYYERKCGRRSTFAREMKTLLARNLFDGGKHKMVVSEFKADALYEDYSDPFSASITMWMRFLYGRSLLRLGRRAEALGFLAQSHFKDMDLNSEDNMELFQLTLLEVMTELAGGEVRFGMSMYRLLTLIMVPRFRNGDCPVLFIEFCSSFAYLLERNGRKGDFMEVYRQAVLLYSDCKTEETKLLVSGIGCAFSDHTLSHRESLAAIFRIHEDMVFTVTLDQAYQLRKLEATTKWIYVWAEKCLALKILNATYRKFKRRLPVDHPFLAYCREVIKIRAITED